MTKFSLVSIVLLTAVGVSVVACSSSDDDSSTPSGGSGGIAGSSAAGTAGTSGGGSSGAAGAAGSAAVEAGAGGEGGATAEPDLYARLGGHNGIREKVDLIVGEELKDPIIASYFSQLANPGHTPTAADIEECFTDLLGTAAMGPGEVYPTILANGYVCRDMTTAHATLGIGAGTFQKFVGIAATELTDLGVAPADVSTVGSVLDGTETSIVNINSPSGPVACSLPASCGQPVEGAAGAAGAGAGGEGGAN